MQVSYRAKFDEQLPLLSDFDIDTVKHIRHIVFKRHDAQADRQLMHYAGSPYRLVASHIQDLIIVDKAGNWYICLHGKWQEAILAEVHAIGTSIIVAYTTVLEIPLKELNADTKKVVRSNKNNVYSFCKSLAAACKQLECPSICVKLPGEPFVHKFQNGSFDVYGAQVPDPPVFGCCPYDLKLHEDQVKWNDKYMRPYARDDAEYQALQYVIGYLCCGLCDVSRVVCFAGVSGSGKSTLMAGIRLWWHKYGQLLDDSVLVGKRGVSDNVRELTCGKKFVCVDEVDNANLSSGKLRSIQTAFIKSFTQAAATTNGKVVQRTGNLMWNMNVNHDQGILFNVVDNDKAINSATRRILFVWFDNVMPEATGFDDAINPDAPGDLYHKEHFVRFCFECVRLFHDALDTGKKLHELVYPAWDAKLKELVQLGSGKGKKSIKYAITEQHVATARSFIDEHLNVNARLYRDNKGVEVSDVVRALQEYMDAHDVPWECDYTNHNHYGRMYDVLPESLKERVRQPHKGKRYFRGVELVGAVKRRRV